MKSLLPRLFFFLPLVTSTFAATVNTGALSTDFPGPPASNVNVSNTATVDLSDLSGLTPGHDIIITFSTAISSTDILWWSGSATAGLGSLEMNFLPRLTLTAGAASTFSDNPWTFGIGEWDGGQFAAYVVGPTPASFSLTVPWGTPLNSVGLTLTDLSSVSGPGAVFDFGSMNLDNATLTTTSSPVPEPSAAILGLSSAALLLRRSRRQ